MVLNRDHPDFSLSMEFLTLLRAEPNSLALIAEDLGLKYQRELRGVISELLIQGHAVETCRDEKNGGFCAMLGGKTYRQSMLAAAQYFERIYPAGSENKSGPRLLA